MVEAGPRIADLRNRLQAAKLIPYNIMTNTPEQGLKVYSFSDRDASTTIKFFKKKKKINYDNVVALVGQTAMMPQRPVQGTYMVYKAIRFNEVTVWPFFLLFLGLVWN